MGLLAEYRRIRVAKQHGILMPIRAWRAAHRAHVPYYIACAFLMQETSGGKNIFGHDPTIFVGAGQVTKEKYLRYKRERGSVAARSQGVGPMQITYWSLQDECDDLGGCWKPTINIYYGLTLIRQFMDSGITLKEVARKYNGGPGAKPPTAEVYAAQMVERFDYWRDLLDK